MVHSSQQATFIAMAQGWRQALVVLVAALALAACKPSYNAALSEAQFSPITDSLATSSTAEATIAPYRNKMAAMMGEVLIYTQDTLTKSEPEGALTNAITDLMLEYGRETVDPSIDISMTNNGGIRRSIMPGPITLGTIFELMPFENAVVVLDLTGSAMDSLIARITDVERLGMSFAGMTIKMQGDEVVSVWIGGEPYDRGKTYRIVTIDYLSNGGSDCGFFAAATNVNATGIVMRNFIASYMRKRHAEGKLFTGSIDGRFIRQPAQ